VAGRPHHASHAARIHASWCRVGPRRPVRAPTAPAAASSAAVLLVRRRAVLVLLDDPGPERPGGGRRTPVGPEEDARGDQFLGRVGVSRGAARRARVRAAFSPP
jgi:hypothetical protein